MTVWYAGAYAPAYQTVIYTEWHKPGVALLQQFSWWWVHGCPKHVENRNKHTWKIGRQVCYLKGTNQDAHSIEHKEDVLTIKVKAYTKYTLHLWDLTVTNYSFYKRCLHFVYVFSLLLNDLYSSLVMFQIRNKHVPKPLQIYTAAWLCSK